VTAFYRKAYKTSKEAARLSPDSSFYSSPSGCLSETLTRVIQQAGASNAASPQDCTVGYGCPDSCQRRNYVRRSADPAEHTREDSLCKDVQKRDINGSLPVTYTNLAGWVCRVVCDEGREVKTIHTKSHQAACLKAGSVDLIRNIE
jgi:hypothetical protein